MTLTYICVFARNKLSDLISRMFQFCYGKVFTSFSEDKISWRLTLNLGRASARAGPFLKFKNCCENQLTTFVVPLRVVSINSWLRRGKQKFFED